METKNNSNDKRCRKAINFDLITVNLKKHFGENNYQKGYYEIGKFMRKNGFEHRQGSGYVSKDKISEHMIKTLAARIRKNLPWIKQCVRVIDVTDIGNQYDITDLIKGKKRSSPQRKQQNQQQAKVTYKPITTRKVQPGMKLHR